MPTPQEQFGQIDIYLFDQLVKGNIAPGTTILDAGCGPGRNIAYFLREGYNVLAADIDASSIENLRAQNPQTPPANFRVEPVEAMSFEDACADVVISNTVLHFARDDAHFQAMLHGCWRVLKPGGLFFCRVGSAMGLEHKVEHIEGRRHKSPDGSERYLVDIPLLTETAARIGATLIEPIKTTIVHDLRCMTTWILRKNP